ncbi:protein kinase domain-containing protein [Ditylenchus destructor]|uniref:Protein kinase domain-containing protein n=1 Tax=Ditylenchus destructor TaxID=166010 RepID=A0AAD4NDF4_9BILA|nr:protein kinase domain-containing protein [Ditylenchus destructor]
MTSSILKSARSERSASDYTQWERIGKGGFGEVFKAQNKLGELVAIKKIPKNHRYVRVEDEVRVLQQLTETARGRCRIVRFIEYFSDKDFTYIVMEYCDRGTLRDYVRKAGPLDLITAADVLSQLIEGLSFMHENGIMHRDITASNVLISRIKDGRLFVKLSDFGLTKRAPDKAAYGTCLGTPGYIAPQVRNRQAYGKEADIYSLGAILYFMLNQDEPHNHSWADDGSPRLPKCKKLDEKALDALTRMMWKQEDKRITLTELEYHPFVRLAHERRLQEMNLNPPRAQLTDSGRGSSGQTGSNYRARSLSRCRHAHRDNNICHDCRIPLAGNPASDTLRAVTNVSVPKRNVRKIISADYVSTYATTKPTNFVDSSAPAVKRNLNHHYEWPIPDVRHLEYIHTNNYGRCAIRKDVNPAIVYEMPDKNFNAKLIFEVYFNTIPNKQRLVVYEPEQVVRIPNGREPFITKKFESEKKFRSQDDVLKANEDIKCGYRRIHQFINFIKTKVSRCYIKHAFGHSGYNLDLKYNDAIELNFNGTKATQTANGEFKTGFSEFTPEQQVIAKCGCLKLRHMADNSIFDQLSGTERKAAENYLKKPFAILWAKDTAR